MVYGCECIQKYREWFDSNMEGCIELFGMEVNYGNGVSKMNYKNGL